MNKKLAHPHQMKDSLNNQQVKETLKSYYESSDQEEKQEIYEEDKNCLIAHSSRKFLVRYNQILNSQKLNYRELNEMIKQLKENGISFNQNFTKSSDKKLSFHQVSITSLKHTKHYQIVTLNIQLGPFSQSLQIYNMFSYSVVSQFQLLYFGKCTNIYRFRHNSLTYIAKSISFSNPDKNISSFLKRKEFLDALREYFITKLMSALMIGPRLCEEFNFDIFMSKNDMFFFIENCENHNIKKFAQNDELLLKANLKEIHLLSFLHRDIKPENIMFSPSFNKFVFIDFGISEYRRQTVGQLIFSNFCGTYSYCSEEMKKLFKSRQKEWIDLHFNDAYGLELSAKQMKITSVQKGIYEGRCDSFDQQIFGDEFFMEIHTKHCIFLNKFDNYQFFEEFERMPQHFFIKIMTFLYEVPITQKIRKFYYEYLSELCKSSNTFRDLKEIFEIPVFFESCKGKREFRILSEKESYQKVQQFYQQLKFQNCQKDKLKLLSIKSFEEILLNKEKLVSLQQSEYLCLIVDYLNCKRIDSVISIEKKIKVCEIYIEFYEIIQKQKDSDFLQIEDKNLIKTVLVFNDVLEKIADNWKNKFFNTYLRALENYFILARSSDIKTLKTLQRIVNQIQIDPKISNLKKIQTTLQLKIAILFHFSKHIQTTVYSHFTNLQIKIEEKVKNYAFAQRNNYTQDSEVCVLFVRCINYFCIEDDLLRSDEAKQVIQSLELMKTKYLQMQYLFNFIQYKALVTLEKTNRQYLRKKQKEEIMIEKMVEDKQINFLLVPITSSYFVTKEIKVIRRYIEFFDTTIQFQNVRKQFFITSRLYIALNAQEVEKFQMNKELAVKNWVEQCKPLLEVKYENLISIFKLSGNILFLTGTLKSQIQCKIPTIFIKLLQDVRRIIPSALKLYESSNQKIFYKRSTNVLYLQMLSIDIEVQFHNKVYKKVKSPCVQKYWHLFQEFASFHKILALDSSEFTQKDHIFMLMYKIIKIKMQKTDLDVFEYLQQMKATIIDAFSKQLIQEKTYILSSFSIILYCVNESNNLNLLNECMNLIYPIVERKFCNSHMGYGFTSVVLTSLVKLSRFDILFNEIIYSSTFFVEHLSNVTLNALTRFYSVIINNVIYEFKQMGFYGYLKGIIHKLDFKKVPLFGVFLLIVIRPFNRLAFLNLIVKSLQHIKFNGKFLILSRFYKELMKVKDLPENKKKYFLKKDLRYPSLLTQNLEEMKRKLDFKNRLGSFQGVFKTNLDRKIIKLGKCCQVYSPVQKVHPLSQVLNHYILDKCNQNIYQQWETLLW